MKHRYLNGNIICALPQLKDIFFSKSIIYLTHHNKDGAVGIVLNYKIMNIKGDIGAKEILKKNKEKILNLEIGDQSIFKNFNTNKDFII